MGTIEFSIYNKATGEIRLAGHMEQQFLAAYIQANEGLVYKHANGAVQFLNVGKSPPRLEDRPTLPDFDKLTIQADNADAAKITFGSAVTVMVDGLRHDVPAGDFVFKADSVGTYAVEVTGFPYIDRTYAITAISVPRQEEAPRSKADQP